MEETSVQRKSDCYHCGESVSLKAVVCPHCGNDPFEKPKEKTRWDQARHFFGQVVWQDKLFFANHVLFWFGVFAYPMMGTYRYDDSLLEHYYQFAVPWWHISSIFTICLVLVITSVIPYVLKKQQDPKLAYLFGGVLALTALCYVGAAVLYGIQRFDGKVVISETTKRVLFTGSVEGRPFLFTDYNLPIALLGIGLLIQLWKKHKQRRRTHAV